MPFFELNDVFGYQDANDIKKLWADTTEPNPATVETGEIWLDTSSAPYKLKRYNGTGWDIIAGGITVDSEGKVGIGTTTPTEMIHVITDSATNAKMLLQRDAGASATINGAATSVNIGSTTYHPLRFVTDGSVKVIIMEDGKVGIGTTNPENQLHVTESGSAASIKVERTDSGIKTWMKSTGTGGMIGTESSHDLQLLAGNGPKMTITPAGNVGIGTTTPGAELDVNGDANVSGTLTAAEQLVIPTSQPTSLQNGSIWIA
jgi:hypothetical protein